MKRVMCFGTFDLVHPGHIWFLKKARSLGDELLVVVSCDERRQYLAGTKPIHNQKERATILRELKFITRVILGGERNVLAAIKKYKPQIIVLGHDQVFGVKELLVWTKKQLNPPQIIRLKSFQRARYSSTNIRKKICR